jgi:preprotein translocase subunit SecG
MSSILAILLIIVCVALAFVVLIQNPKGGGLSGSFGGFGQQMMGVQQSTDTVEKSTWILSAVMGILCLLIFVTSVNSGRTSTKLQSADAVKGANVVNTQAPAAPAPAPASAPAPAPTPSAPAPAAPAPAPAK